MDCRLVQPTRFLARLYVFVTRGDDVDDGGFR